MLVMESGQEEDERMRYKAKKRSDVVANARQKGHRRTGQEGIALNVNIDSLQGQGT